jgi:CDP-glycerol glycerophosphotransferase (TagB/SpsB family)
MDEIAKTIIKSNMGGAVMVPDMSLYDYFLDADLLITDISSVISDFLYLNRPVIVTNPLNIHPMEEKFPIVKACYILDTFDFRLEKLLADALLSDSLKKVRTDMREYVLGPESQNSLELFNTAINVMVEESVAKRYELDPKWQAVALLNDIIAGVIKQ